LVWHGTNDVRVERVPDPKILNGRDAIVKITSSAICGSDLHLLDGYIPTMQTGDILGHEFMGEVVEVGAENKKLKVGDRVVGPLKIVNGIPDEKVLFLSDILPTGYMAAENCDIKRGDVIAVWGCGPVGQMAIRSAWLLGAERVIAIDAIPERLRMAKEKNNA